MKLLALLLLFNIFCIRAHSQIFVKSNALGNNDGTSWLNAYTDLQDAFDAGSSGQQIWIASGTYVPKGPTPDSTHFLTRYPFVIYGGFAGNESTLNERDWLINPTILSGDVNGDDVEGDFFTKRTDNAHHVLIIDASNGETTIDGLIFKSGTTKLTAYSPDSTDILGYDRWRGGALYLRNSTAEVKNCTFRDNNGYQGSGLFAKDATSISNDLLIENSTFELNNDLNAGACMLWPLNSCTLRHTAFNLNNAGTFGAGLVIINTNSTLEDCTFSQNFASTEGGGCFIAHNSKSINPHPFFNFSRCHFTANNAGSSGGAIKIYNYAFGFDLTFNSCTFNQNFVFDAEADGGAISIGDFYDGISDEPENIVRFSGNTFSDNYSYYGGGAIFIGALDDSLQVDISHSRFLRNTCYDYGQGGALNLFFRDYAIFNALIEQTEFDGNTANVGGGIQMFNYYTSHSMSYVIDSCVFRNNIGQLYAGALSTSGYGGPGPIGSILNSKFIKNQGIQASGAIDSYLETLLIDNCLFSENSTQGTFSSEYNGGGAITIEFPEHVIVKNSIFEKNISENEGGAVFLYGPGSSRFENVLMNENSGKSALYNGSELSLMNTTIINNERGLILKDSTTTEIQNSIFKNDAENLLTSGFFEVISNGGNISSDGSMSDVLTGYGIYDDLNNTDPLLGPDFVPLSNSPCVDAGNPEGITSVFDLAGSPRIHGSTVDIGSYESFTVAVKDAVWDDSNFKVFPNPVKEMLTFEFETGWSGEFKLVIFNYLGQQAAQTTFVKSESKQTFRHNVMDLPPGEYALLAVTGNETYATMILIQR